MCALHPWFHTMLILLITLNLFSPHCPSCPTPHSQHKTRYVPTGNTRNTQPIKVTRSTTGTHSHHKTHYLTSSISVLFPPLDLALFDACVTMFYTCRLPTQWLTFFSPPAWICVIVMRLSLPHSYHSPHMHWSGFSLFHLPSFFLLCIHSGLSSMISKVDHNVT